MYAETVNHASHYINEKWPTHIRRVRWAMQRRIREKPDLYNTEENEILTEETDKHE